MRKIGLAVLALGAGIALYAINMDVSYVDRPLPDNARVTVQMLVKPPIDQQRASQRQANLIFGGFTAVVGAVLFGFGSIQPKASK